MFFCGLYELHHQGRAAECGAERLAIRLSTIDLNAASGGGGSQGSGRGALAGLASYLFFSIVFQEAFSCQENKLPSQELRIVSSPLPQEPFSVTLAAKDEKE